MSRLDERPRGHAVTPRGLDFPVVGGSVDPLDLIVVQDLDPDPAVPPIPKLSASTQWRELVHGHVVADFLSCEDTPRNEVATKTTVSGRTDNPQTSTGETVSRLIQNACVLSILRGFDREVARIRRA